MIRRLLAALCCLATLAWAAGCSDSGTEPTGPAPTITVAASIPSDGVALRALGYQFAPDDFSVPSSSIITQRVDQENTVVAVFTAPGGLDIAEYLRETLPGQGWAITADDNNSLLFERGEVRGAFTVTGAFAGLSLRWDAQS